MTWEEIWQTILGWLKTDGVKIALSLIGLFIVFRIITVLTRKIEKKALNGKHHMDKTITKTLMYILRIALKVLAVVCVIGFLGIDTSGITALIASLGVCAGLAVNGALSNLAGGVLLIITRPFKVDDYIEACGEAGTVEDIRITQTRLRTADNKVVYLPNGSLSTSTIINYSEKDTRRVDLLFSIGYSDDFEKAKSIISEIVNNHELILKDPAPLIRMKEHGASSINIVTRVWTKNSDYWTVYFDLLETVKSAFDKEGIEIPFNQLDVHVKKD